LGLRYSATIDKTLFFEKFKLKVELPPTKRKEAAGYAYCDLTIVDKIIEVH
jgi:hypothetical protein